MSVVICLILLGFNAWFDIVYSSLLPIDDNRKSRLIFGWKNMWWNKCEVVCAVNGDSSLSLTTVRYWINDIRCDYWFVNDEVGTYWELDKRSYLSWFFLIYELKCLEFIQNLFEYHIVWLKDKMRGFTIRLQYFLWCLLFIIVYSIHSIPSSEISIDWNCNCYWMIHSQPAVPIVYNFMLVAWHEYYCIYVI